MVIVQKIQGHDWMCNCYIIQNGTEALIIDPGGNYELLKNCLVDIQPKAILVTHGHYDHITNVAALKREYNIPFYIHSGDARLIKHANFYIKLMDGKMKEMIEIPKVDHFIENDSALDFGFVTVNAMHTPGHTAGSICYSFDDNLFTGDLLLKNDIGRSDLPGGNLEKLRLSVQKINKVFDNPVVFPGHGDNSTLASEREFNTAFIEIIAGK